MATPTSRTALRASRTLRAPATTSFSPAAQQESRQVPSNILGAFRGTGRKRASGFNAGADDIEARNAAKKDVLKKGANRDPELYTLGFIMTCAFGMAGYHFARKPTSSSSEQPVSMAPNSKPWESGTSGKYQYHPGGDRTKAPKDAPSALHSVIVPNVTLPRHLHDQFNKYDKEEFDDY